jgi:16S rRNA (cytosine967-C5)-methyltransferase
MGVDRTGSWLRAEAAKAVDAVASDGRSLDDALADAEERVRPDDRPMLRMLAYGTLRNWYRLASYRARLLDRPLKRRDSVIEALLAVGLFQLTDTRVPDHAAVSMTVEAARLLRRPKYAGLVNAILRNFGRKKIAETPPDSDEARYDHPQWLIDRLRADWPDEWESILAANNERAPMWLRVNRQRQDAASWLESAGVDGSLQPGIDSAVRLAMPLPVDDLPGFSDGSVSVQDAAAQLAAPWLLHDGGKRVLDACAAPGGKTGHLLEILGPDADVTALDVDASRLERVRENLDRIGASAVMRTGDAAEPGGWHEGADFDRILLDAPCSATGVIRRHPDIKLLRRDDDIDRLARLQGRILAALWGLLAPGGRLLYVTCSVLAAENESVVGCFLGEHADAAEVRLLHDYNIRDLMCERAVGYQVVPGTAGMDGFYYACLEKAADQ